MRFARWVFLLAGLYGLAVVTPHYFLESRVGRDYPPAVTHPEYFYGFAGVALAFQILFLLIARDPVRLRPAMPAAVVEKASFAVAVPVLLAQHRAPPLLAVPAGIDALLGILFLVAYLRTPAR